MLPGLNRVCLRDGKSVIIHLHGIEKSVLKLLKIHRRYSHKLSAACLPPGSRLRPIGCRNGVRQDARFLFPFTVSFTDVAKNSLIWANHV